MVGDSSSASQESSSSSTNNINITLNLDKSGKQSEEQSQDGDNNSKDQRERMKEFTENKMQVLSVIVEEQNLEVCCRVLSKMSYSNYEQTIVVNGCAYLALLV